MKGNSNMCFELAKLVDEKWLASITEEEAPVQAPAPVRRPRVRRGAYHYWDFAPAPEPEPVQAQVPARVRADVWLLTLETELYASVLYDKRKQIDQHALSQV